MQCYINTLDFVNVEFFLLILYCIDLLILTDVTSEIPVHGLLFWFSDQCVTSTCVHLIITSQKDFETTEADNICISVVHAQLPCFMIINMVFQKSPQKMKARVDAVFFRQLRHLLSIVIPGPFSSEIGFLSLVAIALIARSLCDLWFIHTSTYIEK
jgi:hypothetical protein